MMTAKIALCGVLVLATLASATAQTPRLISYGGVVTDAFGAPRTGPVTLAFSLYGEAEGGVPLLQELQTVVLDAEGRYTALLGATLPDGLPMELFTSRGARWLGVRPDGDVEGPRVLLVSVPYALRAADADTIGGKPASAFLLAGEAPRGMTTTASSTITPMATAGTAGFLGVFTNSTDLGSSVFFQSGTNIGVRTTTPGAPYHSVASEAPGAFFDVYSNSLGALPVVFRAARGTPAAPTPVQANDILGGLAVRGYATTGFPGGKGQVMFRAAENWTDAATGTFLQITTTPIGSTTFVERIRVEPSGRVGIGTSTPAATLHVAGDVVVDGNIAAKYQDVAEWVESGEPLAPGTVVVVNAATSNGVRPSTRQYDTSVMGVVSAQPGVTLGEPGETKSLVAHSGRVLVNVDTRHGPIRAGDLLVSSPTPGHAMASKALRLQGTSLHRPGTILGKALETSAPGKRQILVLLTLQ